MRQVYDEHEALRLATKVGADSPCAKSKRGVVLFCRTYGMLGAGCNHPPDGFECDGSDECHAACNRVCVHAEMDALAEFTKELRDDFLRRADKKGDMRLEMLHVKVVDGVAVPSGEPSCWQCSRHVINFGVTAFWLLHASGLHRYGADEFHEHTLRTCKLPVIR
jgi:deoxycytidylate deaminase